MKRFHLHGIVAALFVFASAGIHAQSFAIFSPAAVQRLPAEKDSTAGKKVLRAAAGQLAEEPHPIERVHTQSTLPGKGIRDESIVAERDWEKMLNLALAYRLTADAKYLDASEKFLAAWVAVYKVSLQPIDETRMDTFLLTMDLLRGKLKPPNEKAALAWFRGMAEGYTAWMEQNGQKDIANWSSHRLKLAVLAAYEVGDPALQARAAKAFRDHLALNMRSDGSVEDFYKRDALHYVVYDLDPMQMAALAAHEHGEDWFHAGGSGRTLAHGIDWLLPYAKGEQTHEEFVHSSVKLDAARDQAGEKGYSGTWDPAASVNTLALAALLDAKYTSALAQVAAKSGKMPAPWMLLYSNVRVAKLPAAAAVRAPSGK